MTEGAPRIPATFHWRTGMVVAAICIAAVMLRVIALDSDAFPGLSWSSALLTDEGFYIHNARNVVLFGTAGTDQFNNMLIMPALHAVQVLVFRIWGVGAVQSRMITVVASLATLPLFYMAIYRSLGNKTAAAATVFLALDHVYFLYNRLALMDSPATSVLIVMLYLWVMGQLTSGWKRNLLLFGCGLSLILAYSVRGLAAPICIAPFAAIWFCHASKIPTAVGGNGVSRLSRFLYEASPLFCGLLVGVGFYLVVWYLPNRADMVRVNHYYLSQLLPDSLAKCGYKAIGAIFGDARGMAAYLIRHSSAVFLLALAWILTRFGELLGLSSKPVKQDIAQTGETSLDGTEKGRDFVISDSGRSTLTLAAVWLLTLWLVLAATAYSPSRYYLLCYPAMSILAGHAVWEMSELISAIACRPIAAGFLLGLTSYHVTLVAAERCFPKDSSMPVAAATLAALVCAAMCVPHLVKVWGSALQCRIPVVTGGAIVVWAVLNVGWTALWIGHLTYRQRDSDTWLAKHLPANSMLFGAVAPGLCMNNRFRAICVIQGLCNDRDPLHDRDYWSGEYRYVLMLDDDWREHWWDSTYPGVLIKRNRIETFPHILRSNFVVGVYKVPEAY